MNLKDKIIFVDETGQSQLDVSAKSISNHYILTAVAVNRHNQEQVFSHFNSVVQRYFSRTNEMKSDLRSLTNKPDRRLEILQTLTEIDFSLYVYVVNKIEIKKSSGLRFPKSFIKFFYDKLCNRIVDDYGTADILGDEIKTKNFCHEFLKYMKKKLSPESKSDNDSERLFYPFKYDLVKSVNNVGVQAADFIAGTIAQGFEGKASQEYHEKHMKVLAPHIIDFVIFPELNKTYTVGTPDRKKGEYDHAIEQRAMYESSQFIKIHENSEEQLRKEQVLVLCELRQAIFNHGTDYWVQVPAILNNFVSVLGTEHETIPRGVIGGLRDAGVPIVSRMNGGYKLATSKADYYRYLDLVNSQISPMIHRVITARNIVRRATDRKIDILDEPAYKNLRDIASLSHPWINNEI